MGVWGLLSRSPNVSPTYSDASLTPPATILQKERAKLATRQRGGKSRRDKRKIRNQRVRLASRIIDEGERRKHSCGEQNADVAQIGGHGIIACKRDQQGTVGAQMRFRRHGHGTVGHAVRQLGERVPGAGTDDPSIRRTRRTQRLRLRNRVDDSPPAERFRTLPQGGDTRTACRWRRQSHSRMGWMSCPHASSASSAVSAAACVQKEPHRAKSDPAHSATSRPVISGRMASASIACRRGRVPPRQGRRPDNAQAGVPRQPGASGGHRRPLAAGGKQRGSLGINAARRGRKVKDQRARIGFLQQPPPQHRRGYRVEDHIVPVGKCGQPRRLPVRPQRERRAAVTPREGKALCPACANGHGHAHRQQQPRETARCARSR